MKVSDIVMPKHEKKNPFRPTFGSIPVSIAGREDIMLDILDGLRNKPGDPNRSCIFSGPRGTGKTVLLTAIANIAESEGWISVNVTSGQDMLKEILLQMKEKASHILTPAAKARISGLSIGGVGFSVTYKEEPTSWRIEMTRILEELEHNETGLLITVDEISSHQEELKILIDNYQHFIRENRNIALLMAGLPQQVSTLLQEDRISFLRRAFLHEMGMIPVDDVAQAIRETIEEGGRRIEDKALWNAAEKTGGFAFLIQLLGYHMWRQSPENEEITSIDVERAYEVARRQMERTIFEVTSRELTGREHEFLSKMTEDDEESRVSIIAKRMEISANNATKIKRRLLDQGLIRETGRGRVAIDVPLLKEYLINKS